MRDQDHRAAGQSPAASSPSWLPSSIEKAHARSETFGMRPSSKPDYDVLTHAELELKREQSRVLCSHALPVMETLHEQIVNTQSMIVLTDSEGLILHSIGDDDFLARAEKVALRPGANWAESRQGTNAIGTALAERCAMVVHGDQHYLAANRFLTCSSVPILCPHGDVIGILDVTGDHRSYHQHTMALARMSVQMIENQLFTHAFQESLRLSFHGRPEFIGTLMEGIVAFTSDGRFLSANRTAQFQLGLSLASLRAHTLSSLFQVTSAQLIDQVRRSPNRYVTLNLSNGTVVCARVEFERVIRADGGRPHEVYGTAASDSRLVTRQHAQPSLSRLGDLDTGDAHVSSVLTKVRKVIGKDIPILITGETGTGKELLARAIHNDSPRRDGPFVAVNCASIPESLIESELFGYEEGAFTGARRKGSIGKLLQADGGTLFLDEIGDMPHPLQVRLLRVLQERIVNPLGSNKTIPVDIAIVCATHRNLREMIAQNRFREDLYYRLNGLVVRLPPLRERTDVAVVIEKMLQQASYSMPDQRPPTVAPDVMALFEQCAWPGNFRQLGNLLRTAAAMVDDDREIRREHLPDDFFEDLRDGANSPPHAHARMQPLQVAPADAPLKDVETSAVAAALARHGGNVSAAARALGVSRNFIYRKMRASRGNNASSEQE